MRAPVSTYRLQIRPGFDLYAAASLVPYLRRLGVDWVYLSPILTAEPGSDHGYDVTDFSAVDPARGGAAGLQALSDAAHAAGLGVLVDIVPNHMGVATPANNRWWWSLLAEGRGSRYAEAFDVDWAAAGGRIRLPVLGDGPDELDRLELVRGTGPGSAGVELRYYDHRFPVAEGTAGDGATARQVHDRQHYELVSWRRADAELNYRRFFGVNSLAGVRVEVPWVFEESHAEIRRWFAEGLVDGLRIDHPDGLADPAGYLDRLHGLTGGAYVLVEKILEPGEQLPGRWRCQGTTGYDALAEVDRLFTDPDGCRELTAAAQPVPWPRMIHGTKRAIADGLLHSEVQRLVRLVPASAGLAPELAADALAELLACFPVYRSYLPDDGAGYLAEAAVAARIHRPDLAPALAALLPLLDPGATLTELAVRFQQTSGMVMAKGVEDTAFYRYTRLTSLNEVGADPSVDALDPFGLHAALIRRQQDQPLAMTALTTHDTKRSEDTRARISTLSEEPQLWLQHLQRLDNAAPLGHRPFADLLWQALLGAWPLDPERAHAYALKAAREAGDVTRWTEPDEDFEKKLAAAVEAAFGDTGVAAVLEELAGRLRQAGWTNSLAAKLVQLAMPGVPDVYQGTEFWDHSLVDPDNRRPVDFDARSQVLAQLDAGTGPVPGIDAGAAAKLLVVSRTLRLRRDRPGLFTGYEAVAASGPAADHVFGFDRGGAVALATRLPLRLARDGGWRDTAVVLPPGRWRDELTSRAFAGGTLAVSEVFAQLPVALLAREDA
ncbi:malto-oligosyltrehalose synthase [Arthrobacter sp. I2-34]|uniref:Malto-oligosyltrehalose synthase n=1 Tax=Arthrobacter hankyongi TaxID=2904801 RepID=A0ABS9L4T0_9MICC|nr:malto-oligosyltrehalose synthase [Arthrobacter hankyongi]MCG2621685.1 malto-oligosyltrehalose synthase [Arthrobacter hankyongi]